MSKDGTKFKGFLKYTILNWIKTSTKNPLAKSINDV